MTDKLTETPTEKRVAANEDHIANEDFGLNHFDQSSENESHAVETSEHIDSFYADDLFGDTEQSNQIDQSNQAEQNQTQQNQTEQTEQTGYSDSEGNADPFKTTWDEGRLEKSGQEKKEPRIPQASEQIANGDTPESRNKHAPQTKDNGSEQAVITPQAPPKVEASPSSAPARQSSGTKPITIFAVVAILAAAVAAWLNPGATNDNSDTGDATIAASPPVLGADIQIQRLEKRISSLEQQSSQQRDALNQRTEHLQQQISSLNDQLAKQAVTQRPAPHAKTPTPRPKPARSHASTSPMTSMPTTGWVVNLVSVDSQHSAEKALKRYKKQGIPAEIYSTVLKGKTWYRLRIGGFASKQEAIAQKKYLTVKHGIKDAWIQKP